MRVTFVQPCVGRKPGLPYPRSWLMEPLAFAVLAGLTPPGIDRRLYDDRLEPIPFDEPTDLAAITVETYTARRAYAMAGQYRRRGVRVVLGGCHATLNPEEAGRHADAVLVGEAEGVWPELLADAAAGNLRPRYRAAAPPDLVGLRPDRSIFAGRPYLPLSLVETSRGCRHDCEFCSVAGVYRQSWRVRPVEDVVSELRTLPRRDVFLVDDNLAADPEHLRRLCAGLAPLGLRWVGQAGLTVADDPDLLRDLHHSGCQGLLIGFESLRASNLQQMHKPGADRAADCAPALARLRQAGLSVYGTFVFGYGDDDREAFADVLAFALRERLFFAAFNHLVPFPGTRLYERLGREGRLLSPAWWLEERARFGEVVFRPERLAADELAALCYEYRRRFYALPSVVRRGLDLRANCATPRKAALYLLQNLSHLAQVRLRQGLPLGEAEP